MASEFPICIYLQLNNGELDTWHVELVEKDDVEYVRADVFRDRIEALGRVFDAAENVCIARGMGWDVDGVLAMLDDAVRPVRALLAKDEAP